MQIPYQIRAATDQDSRCTWWSVGERVTLSGKGCPSGTHRCECPNGTYACCPDGTKCGCRANVFGDAGCEPLY